MLKAEQTQKWLSQFELGDRQLAEQLLGAMVLVSRDDFHDHIRQIILSRASTVDGRIALYTERELRHRGGVPHRLFKESRKRPNRAEGSAGPPAVKATKAYDPSVGSEGLVSQLITELCREFPKRFLSQPGPEQIRKNKVRHFWLVTDIVGSGLRAHRYLEAAWRVRSVRSWWSLKLMKFSVFTYSSTNRGEIFLKAHRSHPELFQVMPCPTIDSEFPERLAAKLKNLCVTYDPATLEAGDKLLPWGASDSLGFGGVGALMVFAHGAPNNVPAMFHQKSESAARSWVPLFPSRVTAGLPGEAFGVGLTAEDIHQRLSRLGRAGLARTAMALEGNIQVGEILLLVGALSRRPRMDDATLSRRSGLPTFKVAALCRRLTQFGWIDSQRRLTDGGRAQVLHARRAALPIIRSAFRPSREFQTLPYYPKSLRHPV